MDLIHGFKGFFTGFRSGYAKGKTSRNLREAEEARKLTDAFDRRQLIARRPWYEEIKGAYSAFVSVVVWLITAAFFVLIAGVFIYGLVAFIKWCWHNS